METVNHPLTIDGRRKPAVKPMPARLLPIERAIVCALLVASATLSIVTAFITL